MEPFCRQNLFNGASGVVEKRGRLYSFLLAGFKRGIVRVDFALADFHNLLFSSSKKLGVELFPLGLGGVAAGECFVLTYRASAYCGALFDKSLYCAEGFELHEPSRSQHEHIVAHGAGAQQLSVFHL